MKKLLVLILSVIAAFTAILSLTACGKVDFTIKFSVDGETYASVSTGGSEVIKMPADPQKDGYTFDGWFWDDGVWARPFTANSLLNEPLKSDMTVYAKFSENNVEAEVKSKLLTVNGNEIKGKVANSQTTFSFINDIEVADGANYAVYSDLACVQPVPSKTISLIDGDNVCYILVTNGNDINLYTVTVRRRPIYTVAFDTSGGTSIDSQQVEEDSLAVKPADPEKTGYDFSGFDYDFSKPIVENTAISANWQIITYKISYVLDGGINNAYNPTTYTVEDKVELKPATKTGYTLKWSDNGIIDKGSTGDKTFTANWQVITYKISYVLNGGINNADNPITYTVEDKVKLKPATKTGYTFTSWDNNGVIEKGSTGNKFFSANFTADVKLSSDGTTVTGLNNAVSDLVILSEYDGVKVTSIGAYAFRGCSSLTSITIPDSVTSIGDSAFYDCTSLTNVTIGNSVISIGYGAFSGYTSLSRIYYNGDINGWVQIDGLDYLMRYGSDKELYINGELLTEAVIDTANEIKSYAFSGCTSLTSVTIGNGVTSISSSAFYNCTSLTSVDIPDSVTSIGDHAFYNCTSLTSVDIPDSVASIGGSAFSCCTSLNYNEYDNACYLGNDNNPYFVLIKAKSRGITDCNISEKCKFICDSAFGYCTSLTSVNIPDSVASIGSSAFEKYTSLNYNEYDNACYLGNDNNPYFVLIKAKSRGITDCNISEKCKFICDSAFRGCSSLTSITIPDSVTSIGYFAFEDCTSLTNITIGNSVTSIGSSAFSGCTSLTSVTIPNSVTSIGDSAFYGCSSLTSITIPNSVTSIGDYTFYGCSKLTSVTIPDSVTSIGYVAFEDCTSLTSVTIPDSVTSIGDHAFYNCTSLTNINVNDNNKAYKSIDGNLYSKDGKTLIQYAIGKTNMLFTIPDGVTVIGYRAFYDCTSLTSVNIPDSVTSIGNSAFV